jgi:oxygen-independent coproporphyrinogen III oxidase
MLMNADTGAVDHDDIAIESLGNLAQDMIPDARLAPSANRL